MQRRFHRLWQLGLAVMAAVPMVASAQPPRGTTLRVKTTGDGVVRTADRKLDCGDDCSARYRPPRVVRLTASPRPHFVFAGWKGACIGTAPRCAIALGRRSATARATFERVQRSISVTASGPGQLVSAPEGIDCGPAREACSSRFGEGTTIRLIAVPAADGAFGAWGGACAGATGAICDVVVSEGLEASAAFRRTTPEPGEHTVTVTPLATRVTSTPTGIDCSETCTASFPDSTVLTLSAANASWKDGCRGLGRSCTLVVDRSLGVTAQGDVTPPPPPPPPQFGVNVSVAGQGRVTGRWAGGTDIRCGRRAGTLLDCGGLFPRGSVVRLRAAPRRSFARWSGFCRGKRPRCSVTVTAAKTVIATFRSRR